MRLVLIGTGPFATPCFEAILRSEHEVVEIATKPQIAGPGRRLAPPSPVAQLAQLAGRTVWTPEDINHPQSVDRLAGMKADLLVVCDYGRILSADVLGTTRLGGLNLHGSLLPRHRGAAPVAWAIWSGDQQTGVSVFLLTPRMDAGPCLVQQTTAIHPRETAEELERRLAEMGREAVTQAIEMLAAWNGRDAIGAPQDASQATKAPRLKKADGRIQWSQSARAIQNQVRALQPWPGAFTLLARPKGELRLSIQEVDVLEDGPAGRPGEVVALDGVIQVATGEHTLVIRRLQPANKRSMEAAEFIRGRLVEVGQILH